MSDADEGTALYRIRGEESLLLYIGISDDFGRRWKEHAKQQPWWDEMRSMSVDRWYQTRGEAEAAEKAAIKAEKPRYNKAHAGRAGIPSGERAQPLAGRGLPERHPRPFPREEFDRREPLAILGGFSRLNYLPVPEPGDPGYGEWAGRVIADFTLAWARGRHSVSVMLDDLRAVERFDPSPETAVRCRSVRRRLYDSAGLSCPRCSGSPARGMFCLSCGAGDSAGISSPAPAVAA